MNDLIDVAKTDINMSSEGEVFRTALDLIDENAALRSRRVQRYSYMSEDGTVHFGEWPLPMLEARIEAIRVLVADDVGCDPAVTAIRDLLDEVDRLRGDVARLRASKLVLHGRARA